MKKLKIKFLTQKNDTYDCGPVAIINLMRIYGCKKIPKISSIQKTMKYKKGTTVLQISSFLDSKGIALNRVFSPNIKLFLPQLRNSSFIILYKDYPFSLHYTTVYKLTNKYAYLTNIHCNKENKNQEVVKIPLKEFLKLDIRALLF